MSNPMSLEGKRILVAGASSGIGRACAELAASLGAALILAARRKELLEEVRLGLEDPERHLCVGCDLTDDSAVESLVAEAVGAGRLDGLIYSAGMGPSLPLMMYNKQEAMRVFDINYFPFLALMKLCSKKRNINPGFSAVAVSSMAAMVGIGGQCAYAGSKGALSACVRTLAIELVHKGVRVNAVCPSNIRTEMYDAVAADINDEKGMEKILSMQPLGIGTPEQVANAVCFLVSDAASFITGVNLPVDGGWSAQ
ncbi:MAG: SDR family oxidoreductase [Bacteroidales bacterium]|nr:SDR family oxidoreductase [Bacteroidales bacterium]